MKKKKRIRKKIKKEKDIRIFRERLLISKFYISFIAVNPRDIGTFEFLKRDKEKPNEYLIIGTECHFLFIIACYDVSWVYGGNQKKLPILLLILISGPVSWGCRIHILHLCREVRHPNKCLGYDNKQSDGKTSVMLELWEMRSIPSLSLLPGQLWFGVVAPDWALSMGQIKVFDS